MTLNYLSKYFFKEEEAKPFQDEKEEEAKSFQDEKEKEEEE
jgi:hypothetical protein